MKDILRTAERFAVSDLGVLIVGEPGTGKKWLARLIHRLSGRSQDVFKEISCSKIHQPMIEREIFGYESITLSGIQQMEGALEQSDGGTLFFDHISDLPIVTQAKIVRALDHQYFQRVGGYEEVRSNVRIIASVINNRRELNAGSRPPADLRFRSTPIVLNLPPLRERREDIPFLIQDFIPGPDVRNSNAMRGITSEAMRMCLLYDWPFNVRELREAIEFAGLVCNEELIQVSHFPAYLQRVNEAGRYARKDRRKIDDDSLEKMLMEHAMNSSRTKKEAARELGMSVKTFSDKLSRYNLQAKFVN